MKDCAYVDSKEVQWWKYVDMESVKFCLKYMTDNVDLSQHFVVSVPVHGKKYALSS